MNPEFLPLGMTSAKLNQFVLESWQKNADIAYQGYLKYGRGMVCWMWKPDIDALAFYGYAVLDDYLIENFDRKCINLLQTYNPKEFLILGITWEISPDRYNTYYAQLKVISTGTPQSIYSENRN